MIIYSIAIFILALAALELIKKYFVFELPKFNERESLGWWRQEYGHIDSEWRLTALMEETLEQPYSVARAHARAIMGKSGGKLYVW